MTAISPIGAAAKLIIFHGVGWLPRSTKAKSQLVIILPMLPRVLNQILEVPPLELVGIELIPESKVPHLECSKYSLLEESLSYGTPVKRWVKITTEHFLVVKHDCVLDVLVGVVLKVIAREDASSLVVKQVDIIHGFGLAFFIYLVVRVDIKHVLLCMLDVVSAIDRFQYTLLQCQIVVSEPLHNLEDVQLFLDHSLSCNKQVV